MRVPTNTNTTEIEIKKSRFVAYACPCSDLKDIKETVNRIRMANPGANHVVHAAVVGTQFSCSDDKEPKNTAGRPSLEVLKGSGITNILVCIARYFGGTLLGTGGLVKAYSLSVQKVILDLQTEELIERNHFSFTLDYGKFDQVKIILNSLEAIDITENFESEIKIEGKIPAENSEKLRHSLANLSNGQTEVTITSL